MTNNRRQVLLQRMFSPKLKRVRSMPGEWSGRLRHRGPARRDAELCAIYDGLGGCSNLLRYIALLHLTRPPRYRLRSYAHQTEACASRFL
jgi:hypothetical protein